ncbi:MAG: PDC sensor domain-containing protein, partial [Treponema sp.]|nr:PDC sensor domain-containing protein [Treponema sp.]
MAKKNDFDRMSTKKKSRKLFLGMLCPLLTVTIVACTFFYIITEKVLNYYLDAQLQGSVESLSASVLERMNPVTVNIEDFANFAELTEDSDEILTALVNTFRKNLEYASCFYYVTTTPLSKGGLFIHSEGWVPPSNFDVNKREWYTGAIKNAGQICFSNPYIDADTQALAVTISKSVSDANGKVKGVVACDILLDRLLVLLRKINISKNSKMDLVNIDGYYMTNIDSSKIMNASWIEETDY